MRLASMSLKNLNRRRLRAFLCILGVALAACSIVTVGASTSRYIRVMVEMNTFFNGDLIVVAKDVVVIQGFPIGGVIPQTVVNKVAEIEGVEKAVPMLFNFNFKPGKVSTVLPVNVSIGLPLDEWHMIIGSSTFKSGNLPKNDSINQVVVGSSIADQYGITAGSKLSLRGCLLVVSGVFNSPSAVLERSIIMSLKLAQEVYNYPMQINMVIVEPEAGISQRVVKNEIESKIYGVMALTDDERNDLTRPFINTLENWNLTMQGTLLVLSVVLIAVVGMLNVSERRRDFATLDAIGAPSSYIFSIVIIENLLIGVFGGILGILLGCLTTVFLASFYTTIPVNLFLLDVFGLVPPFYMLEIFFMIVGACCVGGIIPALNATRVRIAETLKSEY
ncbi:MAG: hypothetical protein B6U77_03275 [Candidatus Hecatellales archaeon ex4484_218]|nr:MAG: hypothetical protein B6U77_03275 [Candidatus Hecatellales archaeon ex4484_218]